MPCHSPELFRPALYRLVSLRPLSNLEDNSRVRFCRLKCSLELLELLLGLAVLTLLQGHGPSNGPAAKTRLERLALS